jgi:hypothetical protein
MRRILLSVLFMSALATAAGAQTAAPAATPDTTATPATTPAPANTAAPAAPVAHAELDNTVVCKEDRTTGSLFVSKICHPAWQWKQMEDAANEALRMRQSHPGAN